MKTLLIVLSHIVLLTPVISQQKSLYDFEVKDIYGDAYDLSQLKGKKVLIVNTASKCGYTSQYAELEELYKKYGGDDFTIIGFPANNFMNQEPGTNEEIATFCQVNYGVTFPMMAKISVKGDDIHPLYDWLTHKSQNGVLDQKVGWNFNKFMIDEQGNVADYAPSKVSPLSDEVVNWITGTE